jgi:vancomycin permeability regulator SanA
MPSSLINIITALGGYTPTVCIGVFVGSGFVLVIKRWVTFPRNLIPWIWVILLFSASFFAASLLTNWHLSNQLEKRLHNLTAAESDVLRTYIDKKHLTGCFHHRLTGALKALERDKVLYLTSKDTSDVECYNLERWAFLYLLEHPELLKPIT